MQGISQYIADHDIYCYVRYSSTLIVHITIKIHEGSTNLHDRECYHANRTHRSVEHILQHLCPIDCVHMSCMLYAKFNQCGQLWRSHLRTRIILLRNKGVLLWLNGRAKFDFETAIPPTPHRNF